MEECPLLINTIGHMPKQVNTLYSRPINNMYTPTYNPNWRNHSNHSWSQRSYKRDPNYSTYFLVNGQFSRPIVGVH